MIMIISTNAIPYFVLKACGQHIELIDVVSMCLVVNCAISFIPTPGNSGAAEGAFFIVFASLSGGFLAWGTMLWRVASYYTIILAGIIVILASSIRAKRRAKLNAEQEIKQPVVEENK